MRKRALSASTSIVWVLRSIVGSAQISSRVRSGPIPASASAAATLTLAGKPRAPSRAVPSKTLVGPLSRVERDAALDEIGRALEARRRLARDHAHALDLALGRGAHGVEPQQRARRHDDARARRLRALDEIEIVEQRADAQRHENAPGGDRRLGHGAEHAPPAAPRPRHPRAAASSASVTTGASMPSALSRAAARAPVARRRPRQGAGPARRPQAAAPPPCRRRRGRQCRPLGSCHRPPPLSPSAASAPPPSQAAAALKRAARPSAWTATTISPAPCRCASSIASMPARLGAWLEANVPGCRAPVAVEQFKGGQSNPDLSADDGGRTAPRAAPQAAGQAAAVGARGRSRVPHHHRARRDRRAGGARACAVPGRERHRHRLLHHGLRRGPRVLGADACPGSAAPSAARIYDAINDVIARLHRVDYAALGLGDFGRPGNYVARQIDRWTKQYRASETETDRGDGPAHRLAAGERARRTRRRASSTATIASTT